MTIELESPIGEGWYVLVHEWMWNEPLANIDDYGPSDLEGIKAKFRNVTIRSWGVRLNGEPCGAIAYQPISPVVGMFAGIVFAPFAQGRGVAAIAVQRVLNQLWSEGVEKVGAAFFTDNVRIDRFLAKRGAVQEGVLRAQSRQDGVPVDVRLVALFAPR